MRYSELTEEQKQAFRDIGEINGCGGKGGWIKPPSFLFEAQCDHHDWNYFLGGTEVDRFKADHEFYLMMLQDAHNSNYYWYYRFWAFMYYRAVRTFGYKFFNYKD